MFLLFVLAAGLNASAPAPLTMAQAIAHARAASPMRAASESLVKGSTEAARLAGRMLNPLVDVRVENLSSGLTRARRFEVARRGEQAARTSGCRHSPVSRPHDEQLRLPRPVRVVDAGEGP